MSDVSCVIVTPIWRPSLEETPLRSLTVTSQMNTSVDRVFVGPRGLDTASYRKHFPDWGFTFFDPAHFASVQAYSNWMTHPDLYRSLAHYDFLVICQLDSILIRGIDEMPIGDWDYLGAPWLPPVRVFSLGNRAVVATSYPRREGPEWVRWLGKKVPVGNGGLSVRRVSAMIHASEALQAKLPEALRRNLLEDLYFSFLGPRVGLRVAPERLASRIFAESTATDLTDSGELFGFHGLEQWNPQLLKELLNR